MSVQKFDHVSLKVLITGCSGTGKTTLFEKLVRAEKAPRKFFFDHLDRLIMRGVVHNDNFVRNIFCAFYNGFKAIPQEFFGVEIYNDY